MENVSARDLPGVVYTVTDEVPITVDQNNTDSGNESYEYDPYYYYYGEDYYYAEDEPYILKVYPFELTTLGIVRPVLIILTAITNIFVVVYFMTKKKRGNSTNLLFVSIAFSDTLTGVLLLPNSFHVYAAKNDELSREWCGTYMILRLYLSRVFHTVSVWQTLFLGTQRYMCVCHPFLSGRVCTTGKTVLAIAVAYVLAFVLHVFHVLDEKRTEMPPTCEWRQEIPCSGMCVYLWFCVVLQHLVPCLVLAYLTAKTLYGLRRATSRLSVMSKSSVNKRSSRDRTITITSIVVVVVFLIPELPHGFYKLVLTISAHGQHEVGIQGDTYANHVIICIYELALLVSFHANFWIYCSMMHDFRQAIVRVAKCEALRGSDQRLKWHRGSTSSRKNSVVSSPTLSRRSQINRNRVLSQTTSILSNTSETAHGAISVSNFKQEHHNQHVLQDGEHGDASDDVFV